jgi:NitT/TauT family transport system substrate-binding protein
MLRNKKWFSISLLVVAATVLAACGSAATEVPIVEEPAEEPAELTPVNIRLSWLVKGEFVHVYMAKELGYFEEEGLDVTILEGSPDVTPMQFVVSGEDQFAYVAMDDVARGRAEGARARRCGAAGDRLGCEATDVSRRRRAADVDLHDERSCDDRS